MSGRKLGRLAGLVLVLAAVIGGPSTAAFAAERSSDSVSGAGVVVSQTLIDWN
jgi:hypothetical protein